MRMTGLSDWVRGNKSKMSMDDLLYMMNDVRKCEDHLNQMIEIKRRQQRGA